MPTHSGAGKRRLRSMYKNRREAVYSILVWLLLLLLLLLLLYHYYYLYRHSQTAARLRRSADPYPQPEKAV